MKKSIFYWQVAGTIFTIALGVLFYFLFNMTIFAIIESKFLEREYELFWCVKLKGILLGLLLIPVFYYTYTGALGVSADWVNIANYVITVGIVFLTEIRRFQKDGRCILRPETAIIVLCIIALVFTVFTFATPKIPIFKDPVTGSYGFYELK